MAQDCSLTRPCWLPRSRLFEWLSCTWDFTIRHNLADPRLRLMGLLFSWPWWVSFCLNNEMMTDVCYGGATVLISIDGWKRLRKEERNLGHLGEWGPKDTTGPPRKKSFVVSVSLLMKALKTFNSEKRGAIRGGWGGGKDDVLSKNQEESYCQTSQRYACEWPLLGARRLYTSALPENCTRTSPRAI